MSDGSHPTEEHNARIPDFHELGERRAEQHVVGDKVRCIECKNLFGPNEVTTVSVDPYSAPICRACSIEIASRPALVVGCEATLRATPARGSRPTYWIIHIPAVIARNLAPGGRDVEVLASVKPEGDKTRLTIRYFHVNRIGSARGFEHLARLWVEHGIEPHRYNVRIRPARFRGQLRSCPLLQGLYLPPVIDGFLGFYKGESPDDLQLIWKGYVPG